MVSRLQKSSVPLRAFVQDIAVILPEEGRERITMVLEGYVFGFSPEEAYSLGSALVEHGQECGYDPDTGETTPV